MSFILAAALRALPERVWKEILCLRVPGLSPRPLPKRLSRLVWTENHEQKKICMTKMWMVGWRDGRMVGTTSIRRAKIWNGFLHTLFALCLLLKLLYFPPETQKYIHMMHREAAGKSDGKLFIVLPRPFGGICWTPPRKGERQRRSYPWLTFITFQDDGGESPLSWFG